MRAIDRLVALLVCTVLVSCSASAVERQATTQALLATANNSAVAIITGTDGLYESALKRVAEESCGHATPCDATDQEVLEDVAAERRRWAPVRTVWRLARVAVEAWREQIATCRELQSQDAGAQCMVQLAGLASTALAHVSDLRCALRGLGVDDPFPGQLDCGMGVTVKDGGQ